MPSLTNVSVTTKGPIGQTTILKGGTGVLLARGKVTVRGSWSKAPVKNKSYFIKSDDHGVLDATCTDFSDGEGWFKV